MGLYLWAMIPEGMAQTIYINEIMASNGTTVQDEDGDYPDWIELYNPNEEAVDLTGWGLSDDYDNPFRWTFGDVSIQPGEFLLVWASGKDRPEGEHLHTSWAIDASGEEVLLTDTSSNRVDELPPTPIPRDVSYGRQPDGNDNWRFFSEPTPGASNDTQGFDRVLDPPELSHTAGFYAEPFDLTISHTCGQAVIRYTLDGSEPGEASPVFPGLLAIYSRQGELNIYAHINPTVPDRNTGDDFWEPPGYAVDKATMIRVRAFSAEAIPSRTVTTTYFVEDAPSHEYGLPVLSVVVASNDFFSVERGIYVPGTATYATRSQANFAQRGEAWERPVHLEFFEKDGNLAFAQDAGARIHGGATRRACLKSLRFYARNDYGEGHFQYALFPDLPDDTYKRFMIRNSGQDLQKTMFRDAFIQRMVNHMRFDTQAYRPVIVFLNGEYWGIHNMRERYDQHYLARTYGVDPDAVDMLKGVHQQGDLVIRRGDSAHYRAMRSYIETHGVEDPEHYDYIRTQMDTDNYADYLVAQIYINNRDWPGNNAEYWRAQTETFIQDAPYGHDGRWRWMMFDTDLAWWFYEDSFGYGPKHNTLSFVTTSGSWPRPAWATFLIREMLKNEDFRNKFANRMADQLNSAFLPERVIALIDAMESLLAPEMEEHIKRHHRPHLPGSYPGSVHEWTNNVGWMRSFALQRPAHQRQHICSYFNLAGEAELTLDVGGGGRGTIRINTIDLTPDTPGVPDNPYPWSGIYFQGIPVEVEAVPEAGYRFNRWEGADEPEAQANPLTFVPEGDRTLTAVFERATLLHYWSFNDPASLPSPTYTINEAALYIAPGDNTVVTNATGQDFFNENTRLGEETGAHLRINNPLGATNAFMLPTTGYEDLVFQYETRRSGQGAGVQVLEYTTNGTDWAFLGMVIPHDDPPEVQRLDLSEIDGVNNNPDFAIRITFEEGDGDSAGNNRFDNVTLEGMPMDGVNRPPFVDEAPELVTAMEGGDSAILDLHAIFHNPDEDPVTFHADIKYTSHASAEISGGQLSLSGLQRGETEITLTADDGIHPPVPVRFRLLIFPEARALAGGEHAFTEWDPDAPERTYPSHMMFLQADREDTQLETPLEYAYHLEAADYHGDDSGTIGYPYNNTRRTRITGLGQDGIAFINTGQGRDLGGALLAVDTRGLHGGLLFWTGGTETPNDRVYALRLQYRVGTEGPFLDVLDAEGRPIEYVRNDTAGHAEHFGPVALPPDAVDEEYVQLLWRYYRVSGTSGPRAELRLDDVAVWGTFDSYADWQAAAFPDPDDLDDPAISGPSADPLDSGAPNLLRYALDMGLHEAPQIMLPTARLENGAMIYSFRMDPEKSDLAYLILASSDLSDWSKVVFDSRIHPEPEIVDGWVHIEISMDDEHGMMFFTLEVLLVDEDADH